MTGPFGLAALFALTIAAALFVRWFAARTRLTDDARDEYEDRRLTKTATIKGVDKKTFVRLYVAAHEPRWAIYAAATLISTILISPPAFVFLNLAWPFVTAMLEPGPWYDSRTYPWMFYIFFGICAIWASCGFVAARIHHARRPEPFQAALARARGEPLEDVVIPRKRPKWAKNIKRSESNPAPEAEPQPSESE